MTWLVQTREDEASEWEFLLAYPLKRNADAMAGAINIDNEWWKARVVKAKCSHCHDTGIVPVGMRDPDSGYYDTIDCPECTA